MSISILAFPVGILRCHRTNAIDLDVPGADFGVNIGLADTDFGLGAQVGTKDPFTASTLRSTPKEAPRKV